MAHYSLFIIKKGHYSLIIIPHPDPHVSITPTGELLFYYMTIELIIILKERNSTAVMRESRKFCQRGSNFDRFFLLVDEEREDPSTTISGPLSARQRNAIEWRFAGMPMIVHH